MRNKGFFAMKIPKEWGGMSTRPLRAPQLEPLLSSSLSSPPIHLTRTPHLAHPLLPCPSPIFACNKCVTMPVAGATDLGARRPGLLNDGGLVRAGQARLALL